MILKQSYNYKMSFDIVIPLSPKDLGKFNKQIASTKRNVVGYRNIYIVTPKKDLSIDGCITIDENIFPFNKDDIAKYHGKLIRNGWYLQQLIKLYAPFVIQGMLDRYLVLDSDTFFLRPTTFVDDDGKCLYNTGVEYHLPYFGHMQKLFPSFRRYDKNVSGICHHMMFEKKFISEIFEMVETKHSMPFWKAFISMVDKVDYKLSGASEYEIYFNFMLIFHPTEIKIRRLKWANIPISQVSINDNIDYVSDHVWIFE